MNRSPEAIQHAIAAFRAPDRTRYPELVDYSRDQCYEDCFGGGGLYLAARMVRTLRLQPGDIVLDLGCGKGPSAVFLAERYGVNVIALDLWTSATVLNEKFTARRLRNRILPLHLDATRELPFAENYFDAIFSMNSLSFYGGDPEVLRRLLTHLKPGGQLCIGSEVLSAEFTAEQLVNPPAVYAFQLPPPAQEVNVFEDDFKKQHTPGWWRDLFEASGLLTVETCETLDDAETLYEELVWYEHTHNTDPFDVQISLDQLDWGRAHTPSKSLFVLTAVRR